jgi:hypothetical protein
MTDLYTGGEYLYQLDSELFEFGHGDNPPLNIRDYEESYDIDPEAAILGTLALCNSVISYGHIFPKADEPMFGLTERTIEHALCYDRIEPSKDLSLTEFACLEAEPRLLRSLAWHDGPEADHLGGHNNIKPAAIYFDTSGEPCAYQKASGVSTAYVWRACTVEVQGMRYRLPADCFIHIEYPPADDPRFFYPERSLVAFENMPQQATIDLLRFSTFGIGKALRLDGARTTIERAGKLAEQLPSLARTSPYAIGERVQQLLKDGYALSVSKHY